MWPVSLVSAAKLPVNPGVQFTKKASINDIRHRASGRLGFSTHFELEPLLMENLRPEKLILAIDGGGFAWLSAT